MPLFVSAGILLLCFSIVFFIILNHQNRTTGANHEKVEAAIHYLDSQIMDAYHYFDRLLSENSRRH